MQTIRMQLQEREMLTSGCASLSPTKPPQTPEKKGPPPTFSTPTESPLKDGEGEDFIEDGESDEPKPSQSHHIENISHEKLSSDNVYGILFCILQLVNLAEEWKSRPVDPRNPMLQHIPFLCELVYKWYLSGSRTHYLISAR